MLIFQRRDAEEEAAAVAPADAPADAPPADVFGLGERLNTKLAEEKIAWTAKLGNYSCILQELKIVDKVKFTKLYF